MGWSCMAAWSCALPYVLTEDDVAAIIEEVHQVGRRYLT